jgi:hypothetical protein
MGRDIAFNPALIAVPAKSEYWSTAVFEGTRLEVVQIFPSMVNLIFSGAKRD